MQNAEVGSGFLGAFSPLLLCSGAGIGARVSSGGGWLSVGRFSDSFPMRAQLEFLFAGLASSPRRVSYAEARARGLWVWVHVAIEAAARRGGRGEEGKRG